MEDPTPMLTEIRRLQAEGEVLDLPRDKVIRLMRKLWQESDESYYVGARFLNATQADEDLMMTSDYVRKLPLLDWLKLQNREDFLRELETPEQMAKRLVKEALRAGEAKAFKKEMAEELKEALARGDTMLAWSGQQRRDPTEEELETAKMWDWVRELTDDDWIELKNFEARMRGIETADQRLDRGTVERDDEDERADREFEDLLALNADYMATLPKDKRDEFHNSLVDQWEEAQRLKHEPPQEPVPAPPQWANFHPTAEELQYRRQAAARGETLEPLLRVRDYEAELANEPYRPDVWHRLVAEAQRTSMLQQQQQQVPRVQFDHEAVDDSDSDEDTVPIS
jgi:hypothetical protein